MSSPADTTEAFDPETTFRADLLHRRDRLDNRIVRFLAGLGVALAMLALVGVSHAWRYYFGDLPEIPPVQQLADVGRTPGMTFLDRYGQIVATRGPKYGRAVRLGELPAYVPQAFLAAEDRRFREHGAVDLRGVGRALFTNLKAGETVEGGSTITQQLVKNLFLSRDRVFKRKLQEVVLANRLEARLGKDQILELYLNRVYLGGGAYGVDAAARTYFGKPARELTLAEAAVLAGLARSPSALSPSQSPERALKRGRLVLSRMLREGWIRQADAAAAGAQPLTLAAQRPEGDLAWALDLAADEARARAGGATDIVVRTTIDPALQAQAAEVVRATLRQQGQGAGAGQAALVALGPDGAIRVLIGGRDHDEGPFNRAVQAKRQPGSAFKPLVWAAAVERGAHEGDLRSTGPVAFGPWSPNDHVGEGVSQLTLAEALARSSNTVSARLADETGVDRVAGLARRFGVQGLPERPQLSIALGAYEVSLLQLTGAYQVFQTGGRLTRPYLVEEVARSDGTTLYRRPPPDFPRVYDAGQAAEMTRMMTGVIDHGTGRKAALDRPAAGKTGTTQNNRDAWFVGFTPDWVAGVWVGNDDGRPMKDVSGGDLPAEIWRRFMQAAHAGGPARGFAPVDDAAFTGEETRVGFYATLAAEFERTAAQARP
jgi:penicillin-binding protein 1A